MSNINKLSLVVLNYNDYETTIKLVNSLKNYKIINNIIVVDNSSTDSSYEMLKKINDRNIDIIKTKYNRGYADGNNFGIKYAINKYNPSLILISNPDIKVNENTIKAMKQCLENSDISCVVPRINDINLNESVAAWKLPNLKNDLVLNSLILSKIFKKNLIYSDNELIRNNYIVDVVCGCFFMIKADALRMINYLDDETFLYCEERILGFKLKENNLKSRLLKDQTCIHEHSVSINKNIKSSLKKFKILNESKKIYYYKYKKISGLKKVILRLSYYEGFVERLLFSLIRRG